MKKLFAVLGILIGLFGIFCLASGETVGGIVYLTLGMAFMLNSMELVKGKV